MDTQQHDEEQQADQENGRVGATEDGPISDAEGEGPELGCIGTCITFIILSFCLLLPALLAGVSCLICIPCICCLCCCIPLSLEDDQPQHDLTEIIQNLDEGGDLSEQKLGPRGDVVKANLFTQVVEHESAPGKLAATLRNSLSKPTSSGNVIVRSVRSAKELLSQKEGASTSSWKAATDSIRSMRSNNNNNASSPSCCICQDGYSVGETMAWPKEEGCCHLFHEKCITLWLMNHDDCPICRAVIVVDTSGGEGMKGYGSLGEGEEEIVVAPLEGEENGVGGRHEEVGSGARSTEQADPELRAEEVGSGANSTEQASEGEEDGGGGRFEEVENGANSTEQADPEHGERGADDSSTAREHTPSLSS